MSYALFSIAGPRPVYNIFFFMIGIVATVIILFLLGLEYLPLIFLLVYAGAIAILFLFIILLINVEGARQEVLINRRFTIQKFFLVSIISVFFVIKVSLFAIHIQELNSIFDTFLFSWESYQETKYYYSALDIKLFGYYIYNFFPLITLTTGLILYQAMIGAILITRD
jgi:NADH-quinone oxidoreductase subunit J